jgi:nucleoside-diphosphate-sugar epimerase
VTNVIQTARQKGVAAYVVDGLNGWSAAHVSDAARLFRIVLERGRAGTCCHATAEEHISFRQISETVGRHIDVPVVSIKQHQCASHFGWLAGFVSRDMSASSQLTKTRMGWRPDGPGLLEDVERGQLI